VVKTTESYDIKFSGIRRGVEGLIDNDLVPLHSNQLQRLMHLGGKILKTAGM
jgi:6-phosphofructokinase 1